MGQQIRDIMKSNPVCLSMDTTLVDAAKRMRDDGIGDVLVSDENGRLHGIVTDRDIVVRAVALGNDPHGMTIGDICSGQLTTLSPSDDVDAAVALMEKQAVRRIPIVDGDRPVGIVSIGDLAIERDQRSALGQISAAPPNR